jgi:fatty acid desaturase
MKIFRYREDRVPVLCIILLAALDLLVYLEAERIGVLVGWLVFVATFKACICSWNHHHQHVPTFRYTFFNRILEVIYAFHTGITTNAWVLHHNLGHHLNYLDQTKDESGWMRRDGTKMGTFEYTVVVAATGYLRAMKVGRKHPKYVPAFVSGGLVVLVLLALALYARPLQGFFVYLLPMAAGYVITVWHTYYHHAGLETEDHHEASYNTLHYWYNVMTGNLGYHTAHHMKQGLHWSKLPEFHATIAHRIPPHLFTEPCIPFKWMPASRGRAMPRTEFPMESESPRAS